MAGSRTCGRVRAFAALAAVALSLTATTRPGHTYEGSTFEEVRAAVWAAPYQALPQWTVDSDTLGASGDDDGNHLLAAARRTLGNRADLVDFPGGRKLFQANGICFTGTWRIDGASRWPGLYSAGTEALLIARASVSMSNTRRGGKRAFALAGKLFPTTDPRERVHTANFFAMENALGTDDTHFLDAVLDNHPVIEGLPPSLRQLFLGLRIQSDLKSADRAFGAAPPDPTYRPLYPLAEAGPRAGAPGSAPRWMQLTVEPGTPRVDQPDFRDELRLSGYPDGRLRFVVRVADDAEGGKQAARWERIGVVEFTEDVASPGCDGRLHFAHPPLR